jgi:hypothetical protein
MTVDAGSLQAEVLAVEAVERGLEIRVRMANRADRALHYISDVRALDYDAAARRLTVKLSDEGREIVPGASNVHPPTRYLDPGSEAEVTLRVPAEISRLAPSPDGDPRKVAFERLRIADAEEVVVQIAWADVPFYEDPRPRAAAELVMPSVQWQQHRTDATFRRRPPRRRRARREGDDGG